MSTRRDVFKTLAALSLVGFPGADPDLILYNGLVYTVLRDSPEAAAIAIRDGRWVHES